MTKRLFMTRPDYFIISQLDLNFELLNPVIKFWYKTQINYVPLLALQYGPLDFGVRLQEEDFHKYFKPLRYSLACSTNLFLTQALRTGQTF